MFFQPIDNLNIPKNIFSELCQNSCFGNIKTNSSYPRIDCSGNENSLHECDGTTKSDGCGNAAGAYCSK